MSLLTCNRQQGQHEIGGSEIGELISCPGPLDDLVVVSGEWLARSLVESDDEDDEAPHDSEQSGGGHYSDSRHSYGAGPPSQRPAITKARHRKSPPSQKPTHDPYRTHT